jgi:hypothetical protein
MDEVKINTSKTLTLTLPSDPASNLVSVSLYHEFGDLVSGPTSATRTGTGAYTITYGQQSSGIYILNSSGKYRADFTYTVSGALYTQSKIFSVYAPYATYEEFFEEYPELEETFGSKFDKAERQVRNIINTFTGQSFDPYYNKTIFLNGNNAENLHLPLPLFNLKKVVMDVGTTEEEVIHDALGETSNNLEKVRYQPFNFSSSYFIRWKRSLIDSNSVILYTNRFKVKSTYSVLGDYGWQYVPDNVTQAAILILADMMNDDSAYRRHGFYAVDLDIVKLQSKQSFYESTGNIDADTLLMDYTLFVMDYVG